MNSHIHRRSPLPLHHPFRLLWVALPALVLGSILVVSSNQGAVRADDPIATPPGLMAKPGPPPVHALGAAAREAWEWEVVRLVNEERTSRGIPPLKRHDALDTAAYGHSQDMGLHDFVSHTGSDGSTVGTRVLAAGYTGSTWIGENIAAGHSSPDMVMYDPDWGWMNSPGHCANILSANYREIGMGYYYDAGDTYPGGSWGYGHYWTQDFGSRSDTGCTDVYPVIINNEAYSTTNLTVQLYIYGPGDATHMRFRNEGDAWPDDWETYCPIRENWTLAAGSTNPRTVYAQVRNSSHTYEASDDITYLGADPILSVHPTSVTFLTEQGSGTCIPGTHAIQVSNASGGTLDWDATKNGSWFDIQKGSNGITVTCVGSIVDDFSPGTQAGSVTVTAEDAQNSPQTVTVRLIVTDEISSLYLPGVARNQSNP